MSSSSASSGGKPPAAASPSKAEEQRWFNIKLYGGLFTAVAICAVFVCLGVFMWSHMITFTEAEREQQAQARLDAGVEALYADGAGVGSVVSLASIPTGSAADSNAEVFAAAGSTGGSVLQVTLRAPQPAAMTPYPAGTAALGGVMLDADAPFAGALDGFRSRQLLEYSGFVRVVPVTASVYGFAALECWVILFVPRIDVRFEPVVEWALRCQLPLAFQLSQLPRSVVPANSFLNDLSIGDAVRGPATFVLASAGATANDRYVVRGVNVRVPARLAARSWISQFVVPYVSAPTSILLHAYIQPADPARGLSNALGSFDLQLHDAALATAAGSGLTVSDVLLRVDGLGNDTALTASLVVNATLVFGGTNRVSAQLVGAYDVTGVRKDLTLRGDLTAFAVPRLAPYVRVTAAAVAANLSVVPGAGKQFQLNELTFRAAAVLPFLDGVAVNVVGFVGPLSSVGQAAGYTGVQTAVVATASAGANGLAAILCRVASVCAAPAFLTELGVSQVDLQVSVGTAPMTLAGAPVIDGVSAYGDTTFTVPGSARAVFQALGVTTTTARVGVQIPFANAARGFSVFVSLSGDGRVALNTDGSVSYPAGAGGGEPEVAPATGRSTTRIDPQLFTLNQVLISTVPLATPATFTVSSLVTVTLDPTQPLTFVVSATFTAGAQLLLTGAMVGTWRNAAGIDGLTVRNAGLQLGLSPAVPTGVAVSAFGVWGDVAFGDASVSLAVLVSPVRSQYVVKLHATQLSLGNFVQFIGQATGSDLAVAATVLQTVLNVRLTTVDVRIAPTDVQLGAGLLIRRGFNVSCVGTLFGAQFAVAAATVDRTVVLPPPLAKPLAIKDFVFGFALHDLNLVSVTPILQFANFIVRQGTNNLDTWLYEKATIRYPCPTEGTCTLHIPIGGLLDTIERAVDGLTGDLVVIEQLALDSFSVYDAVRGDAASGALPTLRVRVRVGGLRFSAERTISLAFLADAAGAAGAFVRSIVFPQFDNAKSALIQEVVKRTCNAIKNTCAGALGVTYCLGDVPGIDNICP